MEKIESTLSNSLDLYKTINDTFGCTTLDPEWNSSYQQEINNFLHITKNLENFLASAKDADVYSQQRDMLWTIEFAYRDFANTFRLFEQITQRLENELKKKNE